LRRTDLSNPGFYSIEWTPSKQTTACLVAANKARHYIEVPQEVTLDQCLAMDPPFWLLIHDIHSISAL